MPESERVDWLTRGGCMPWQGRLEAKQGALSRWGARFEFGDSPVHSFAFHDEPAAFEDALRLGAMPFAQDLEDDGVFKYGFANIARAAGPSSDGFRRMLRAAWAAGSRYLDPSDPGWVGQVDADNIRHTIASECFENGVLSEARALGIPVSSSWFLRHEPHLPLLRAMAIRWSGPGQLVDMAACGMDLLSPIKILSDEPPESLWRWLADYQPDPQAAARLLWSAGNDPRVPDPSGQIPLDALRAEPGAQRVAAYAAGYVNSQVELAALQGVGATPSSPRRSRKL